MSVSINVKLYVIGFMTAMLLGSVDTLTLQALEADDIIQLCLDFFQWKVLRLVTFITCENTQSYSFDLNKITRTFSKEFYQVSIIHNSNNNTGFLEPKKKIGVVFDGSCDFKTFLNNKSLFKSTIVWLIIDVNNKTTQLLPKSDNNINSDVTVVTKTLRPEWIFYEVYNIMEFKNPLTMKIKAGLWKRGAKFEPSYQNRYEQRRNLNGLKLRSGIVITTKLKIPYGDFLFNQDEQHLDSLTRFHYWITMNLGDICNFSLIFKRYKSWGYFVDGSWNGIIGGMEKDQVDFGSTGLYIRKDRSKVIKYGIFAAWPLENRFVFRHPKITKGLRNVFIRPLSNAVWELAFVSFVIISVSMKIICYLDSIRSSAGTVHATDLVEDYRWSSILIDLLAGISQQGLFHIPRKISGRILACTFLLFSALFYQFYSASVVSSLLMATPKSIKTLKQLVESDLYAGIESQPYTFDWLANTNDSTELALWKKKIAGRHGKPDNVWSVPEGMRKALIGGYAFHVQINTALYVVYRDWSERAICDLTYVTLRNPGNLYFVMAKNSTLYKVFNIGLLKQLERGVSNRLLKRWRLAKPQCFLSLSESTFHIELNDIYTIFGFLAAGMLLSTIMLLVELGTTTHYQTAISKFKNKRILPQLWNK